MKRHARIGSLILLAAISLGVQYWAHPTRHVPQKAIIAAPKGYVHVAHAVDGDTIELDDGRHVRYLGIDTPETVHPDKPIQCYGPQASARNHALVDGQFVRLVRDIENTDKYGRLLRYVYLQDGTFVNLALVAGGYARVLTYPPNIAHTAEIIAAQNSAKSADLGLWQACRN